MLGFYLPIVCNCGIERKYLTRKWVAVGRWESSLYLSTQVVNKLHLTLIQPGNLTVRRKYPPNASSSKTIKYQLRNSSLIKSFGFIFLLQLHLLFAVSQRAQPCFTSLFLHWSCTSAWNSLQPLVCLVCLPSSSRSLPKCITPLLYSL